jgi:GTP-binding protein
MSIFEGTRFIASAHDPRELPPDIGSEIAFAGRSNAGKSSAINALTRRKKLAFVSKTPGRTQTINFFDCGGNRRLVDLPGYGYAKVPKALRDRWQPLIHGYLSKSAELAGVVQLIDMRTGPTPEDLRSVDYLAELGIPVLFALTKADKLTKTEREKAFAKAVKTLEIDPEQAIPFSAPKGDGREELLETLGSLLFPEAAAEDGEAPGAE